MQIHRGAGRFSFPACILAVVACAGPAHASVPTVPPEVTAAPSGTVNEKTPITFTIKANPDDAADGHWAVLISAGNDEVLALRQSPYDASVYTRTIKLHNQRVYAGVRPKDDKVDFDAPLTASRMFPGDVTWRVAFFRNDKPSYRGEKNTRTATETFTLEHTFDERFHVNKPRLPRAAPHLIRPNRSIGGVKLGMSRRAVLKLWGNPFYSDEQMFERTDDWSRGTVSGGRPEFEGDYAEIYFDQDQVFTVGIVGSGEGLREWHTPKGIRLGSTPREVRKAYPNAQNFENEDNSLSVDMFLEGKDGRNTVFGFSHRRLNQIELRAE
jgi:hypothetical protein